MLWFDWMTNQNLKRGRDTLFKDLDQHIWLGDPSKIVKVDKMISDWLANGECCFPGESFIKIDIFGVRWEKRSDDHTIDERIRKEISPRTKASLAKSSFSEKLNELEKLHQTNTSIVGLSDNKSKNLSPSLSLSPPSLSLSLSVCSYLSLSLSVSVSVSVYLSL